MNSFKPSIKVRCNRNFRLKSIAVGVACCFILNAAQANPIGAQVVNGTASINQNGNTLTVTNNPNAIINWQGFSINTGETTRFIQQSASSAVLNRVLGADPSVLLGTLTSNGKVFLVNPAGILVGQGARIDVAGLVASTLNLSNEDFLAGKFNFGLTPNAGAIQNNGAITTPEGGTVYLVAPQIENQGIITTPRGETILAAGNTVQLIDTGTPGVTVQVTGSGNSATNLGQILADSGRIGMVAATLKNSGSLNASSIVNEGGRIFLRASQDAYVDKGGRIAVSGSKGGQIEVLGNRVAVLDNAQLDASGQNGGGSVLVGGDYQGKNPEIQNANITYFGPQASIKADAIQKGVGGKVIVWADDTMRAYGSISARGGADSGNGGFVETSGHRYLDVAGARVDTRAPQGATGNWLLDPTDITITNGATTAATFPGNIFDNGAGATSSLTDGDINLALNSSSITIQTASAHSGGGILGDITFDSTGAAILISETNAAAVNLILDAENNIVFTGANGTTFRTPNSTGQLDVYLNVPNGKVNTSAGTVTLDGDSSGPYGLTRAWLSAGRAWDNSGTLTIKDNAAVHLGGASSFNNKSGGITNVGGTTGWAFFSSGSDDGIINNEGTINVTKGTAFEAAYNQIAGSFLNVKDVNLNLQNAGSIAGTINLTPAGATTFATLNVNEYHGAPATFTNTSILGAGPAGSTLTVSGAVGTPTASFSGISAPDVQLNVGGASPGNVSIVGDSLFKTVAYTSGTFAVNNAALSINAGNFTIPAVTTHTGNVGYRVRGNLTVNSAFALPGNLDLVGGWNGAGYAVNPGANTDIIFGAAGSLSTSGNIWLNAGNAVTQNAAASITANTLSIGNTNGSSLPGGVSLPGTNMVGTLAVQIDSTTGSLIFSNGQALAIGAGTSSFNGIVAGGNLDPINITTTAGNLTVANSIVSSGQITLAAANTLTLNAAVTSTAAAVPAGPVVLQAGGGGVASNANGIITTAGLKVVSGGSVTLNAANAIDTLVGTSAGSFQFANSKGFAVNTVLATSGLIASAGDIILKAGLQDSLLTISQNVQATTGNVSYVTDNLAHNAITTTSGSAGKYAEVKPFTAATEIEFSAAADAAGFLRLSSGELNFSTPLLKVGNSAMTGNIAIKQPVAPGTFSSLSLITGGTITQTAGNTLTIANLNADGWGGVALNEANAITNLGGHTNAGNFAFTDINAINVGLVDINSGITVSTSGNITLTAGTNVTQSSGALLTTPGSLAVNAATGINLPNANTAPTVNLSNATSGNVTYITGIPALSISAANAAAGNIVITNTGGTLDVTSAGAGSGSISLTGSGNVTLDTATTSGPITVTATGAASDIYVVNAGQRGVIEGSTATLNAGRDIKVTDSYVSAGSLVTANAGRDIRVIATSDDTGISAQDIALTMQTGKLYVTGNTASPIAYVSANIPSTLTLNFNGLSSGGYVINGVEGGATTNGLTGLFVLGSPAVIGSGLTVSYALPPPPPPLTIDQCIADPTISGCNGMLPSLATCTSAPATLGCSVVLPSLAICTASPTTAGCTAVLPSLATCTTAPTTAGCAAVLPSLATCTSAPATTGCTAVLPSLATCTAAPATAGCAAVLPSLATCTAAPATAGCTAVLPSLATCTTAPATAGCTAVLPSLATCTAAPATAGCTAVLPSLATCTSAPATTGCTAVLPSLASCTATPTLPGCSVVLPSLASCTATPALAGCTAVLPSLATCTTAPATAGCTAVLPSLATCTAAPTTAGCTAVLPSLATCIAAPATAGCTAVLPSLAACTSAPATTGCTAVLPSLATCTAAPATAGCTAVLPSLATCTSAPATTGCTAVLPSLATCTAAPATAGCTAVLPNLATCTSAPATTGCTAVLPSLAACTAAPATAGCTAVLPSLATCTSAPTTTGCTAVLPSLAACTAAPATAGCTAVLPSLATCTSAPATTGCTAVLPSLAICITAPATAGCTAVLPSLATCTAAPTTVGCTVVLPSLAACTSAPTTAGCAAVLPSLAACTATPTLADCATVLPSLATCAVVPSTAGCTAVLPPPSVQNTTQVVLQQTTVIPTPAITATTAPSTAPAAVIANAAATTATAGAAGGNAATAFGPAGGTVGGTADSFGGADTAASSGSAPAESGKGGDKASGNNGSAKKDDADKKEKDKKDKKDDTDKKDDGNAKDDKNKGKPSEKPGKC